VVIKNRAREAGFTLLELILVVTLIGFLAAAALQKQTALSVSANLAVLQNMKAALESAASLTYNKSLLAGSASQVSGSLLIKQEPRTGSDNLSAPFLVASRYGYPQALWSQIIKTINLDETLWLYSEQPGALYLWTKQGPGSVSRCNISYQEAVESGFRPQISINESGC